MADNLVMPNGTPSVENFQNWAKTQYGREANPMELQQIGSKVGAPSGPNGQYSQDQYQQAQNYSRELATAQGWKDPGGGGNSAPPQQQAPPPQQQSHQISGVPMTYQAGNYNSQYQAGQYQPNYQPQQFQSTYQPGQNNQAYNQYQFAQFVPQNSNTQGRDQVLSGLLANPHSLSQQWQDQMNEQGKESANAYAKQLGQQASQQTAGRGLSQLGGAQRQNDMEIQQALMSQLLSGTRNTATQAATQNRADELNALGAANATYTADADRARQNYAAQLAGQTAQAGEGQYGNDFGLKQFIANEANKQFGADLGLRAFSQGEQARQFGAQLGLQGFEANEGAKQAQNQQGLQAFAANEAAKQGASSSALNEGQLDFNTADAARQRSLQEFLGVVGAGLEQNRFREDQRQFNQSYGLDAQKLGMSQDQFNRTFGENQRQFNLGYNQNDRQFNDTLGLNWANSQNGQVNNILGFLEQFYGG